MTVTDIPLRAEEYYAENQAKTQIYLHHTAGSRNGVFVQHGWENDKTASASPLRVATAYIISGPSANKNFPTADGAIYRCFPERQWAHHLGTKLRNNVTLNKQSIGIEICAFGQLTLRNGVYTTYVGSEVKPEDVCDLGYTWKGFRYFQKYTNAQLDSLRELMLDLSDRFEIPVCKPYGKDLFELSAEACKGVSGVWTHNSTRNDKLDCFPQPELIAMLNSF